MPSSSETFIAGKAAPTFGSTQTTSTVMVDVIAMAVARGATRPQRIRSGPTAVPFPHKEWHMPQADGLTDWKNNSSPRAAWAGISEAFWAGKLNRKHPGAMTANHNIVDFMGCSFQ